MVLAGWAGLLFSLALGATITKWAPETIPIVALCLPIAYLLALETGPAQPVRIRNRRDR